MASKQQENHLLYFFLNQDHLEILKSIYILLICMHGM